MIQSYFNSVAESIKKRVDYDGYNKPNLEEIGTDIHCRKIRVDELKTTDKGKEVVSTVEVWLPATLNRLPSESTITFDGEEFSVISSEFISGLVVDKFLRVFLK